MTLCVSPDSTGYALLLLSPVLLVLAGAVLILLAGADGRPSRPGLFQALLLASTAGAACYLLLVEYLLPQSWHRPLFGGFLVFDSYGIFLQLLVLTACFFSALTGSRHLERAGMPLPETYALLLFSTAGMMLMVMATDLVALFLGLELMSLPLYVLSGLERSRTSSGEAGIKYFLMGGCASAVLLFGTAHLWGLSGATSFAGLAGAWPQLVASPLAALALLLVLAGILFKLGTVPFHAWSPDIYEGAPTPVTAFMMAGVKVAALGTLLRLALAAFPGALPFVLPLVGGLAFLTMTVGNLAALQQTRIKRLLAWSGIAHAGYLLVGVAALGSPVLDAETVSALLFYLGVYLLTILGAFAVVLALPGAGTREPVLDDLKGFSRRHPLLAFSLVVFLLSLAGLPPTGGFLAKFDLFRAAVLRGHILLVVAAVLNSFLSLYYYLKLIVAMYMQDPNPELASAPPPELSPLACRTAAFLLLLLVLWIGFGGGSGVGARAAENLLAWSGCDAAVFWQTK